MYNIYTYDIAIIKQVCLLNYLTTFASIFCPAHLFISVYCQHSLYMNLNSLWLIGARNFPTTRCAIKQNVICLNASKKILNRLWIPIKLSEILLFLYIMYFSKHQMQYPAL